MDLAAFFTSCGVRVPIVVRLRRVAATTLGTGDGSRDVGAVSICGSAAWARPATTAPQPENTPPPPDRRSYPRRSATAHDASATAPATPNTAGQAPTFLANG